MHTKILIQIINASGHAFVFMDTQLHVFNAAKVILFAVAFARCFVVAVIPIAQSFLSDLRRRCDELESCVAGMRLMLQGDGCAT